MKKLFYAALLLFSVQSFAQQRPLKANPTSKIYTLNEFGQDAASVTILHGSTVKMPDLSGMAGQVLTKNADGSIGLVTPVTGGATAINDTSSTSTTQPLTAAALKKIIDNLVFYLNPADLNPVIDARVQANGGAGSGSLNPVVTTSNLTSTSLTATWTNTGASYYKLLQSTTPDFAATSLAYGGIGTTVNITGLSPNSSYFYQVQPIYGTGVSTAVPQNSYSLFKSIDFSDPAVNSSDGNAANAELFIYSPNNPIVPASNGRIGLPTNNSSANQFYLFNNGTVFPPGSYRITFYGLINFSNQSTVDGVVPTSFINGLAVFDLPANSSEVPNYPLTMVSTAGPGSIIYVSKITVEKQN